MDSDIASPADSASSTTGFVRFDIEADTLFLYLNERYDRLYRLPPSRLLELPAKTHKFLLFGRGFPEQSFRLNIPEDDTLTFTYEIPDAFSRRNAATYGAYARVRHQANLMVLTSEEATITVNGKEVGESGLASLDLPQGNHLLRIIHPSGRSHQEFVPVEAHRLRRVEHYFLPSRKISRASAFFPGASQLHKRQHLKGILLLATTTTALSFVLAHNSRFRAERREFQTLLEQYQAAGDEDRALELGDKLDTQEQLVLDHQRTRNIYFLSACLLYAFNLYDAFQRPRSGYRKPRAFNPYQDLSVNLEARSFQIGFKLEF